MDNSYINDYLVSMRTILENLPLGEVERAIDALHDAHARGSQVFVLGNGGSATTASHMACDFGKGTVVPGQPRWRVISLTDNVPLMTAWANDSTYEDVFVEQLANLVKPRDVVIGISGSGNSANVLKALRYAKEVEALTVAFTGFSGGKVKDIADISIIVPMSHMGRIEDAHMILAHIVCYYFMEKMRI